MNRKAKHPYVDSNMHCMLDPKTDAEIWQMQSGRFGQLYFHRKGLGGVDVCLSDSDHFALPLKQLKSMAKSVGVR